MKLYMLHIGETNVRRKEYIFILRQILYFIGLKKGIDSLPQTQIL